MNPTRILATAAFVTAAVVVSLPTFAQDAGPAPPAAPPTAADGEKIWNDKKAKCATCHGPDGKGDTKMGKSKHVKDMTTAEWQKAVTDQMIVDAVMKGIEREENGAKIKMEPLKGATDRDAQALVAFIRTLAKPK